jgi:hypothetical protein
MCVLEPGSETAAVNVQKAHAKQVRKVRPRSPKSSCLRLSRPGKKQSRADFPFTDNWIAYKIFPSALFKREIGSAVLLARPAQTQTAFEASHLPQAPVSILHALLSDR